MTGCRRIAALPMYDFEPLRASTDAWWAAIAARLRAAGVDDVPAALCRDLGHTAGWHDRRLLFGQACQYPLSRMAPVPVRLVAIPAYHAPGCAGSRYSSAIVVRRDDAAPDLAALRGRRCAVNERESNSGFNLLRATLARRGLGAPFFASVLFTGAHFASAQAVADSRADAAAIDCVSFALIARHWPPLAGALRVLDWTVSSPGLPYVTARDTDEPTLGRLRAALRDAAADPALAAVRAALLIDAIDLAVDDGYTEVRALEHEALARGLAELA